MPKVSVIINCYNGEQYLKEAIGSVYAQSFHDWEIIFYDNASTDKSAYIAKSFDSKLRYFKSDENVSLGAARNEALKYATGEYIGFLDCDDIWLPDKLYRQVMLMSDGIAGLCYGGIIEIDSKGSVIGKSIPHKKNGYIFEQLLYQFDIHLPTAFIRKSFLDKSALRFDPNITASEEYCLFMEYAVEHIFIASDEVYSKYRIHDAALTNKSVNKWAEEREYTLDKIKNKYPGIEYKYAKAFREAYARAVYYRARYYMSLNCKRKAVSELYSISRFDIKYVSLFIISLFPVAIWNYVHKIKSSRNL